MVDDYTKCLGMDDVALFCTLNVEHQWMLLWFADWFHIPAFIRIALREKLKIFQILRHLLGEWIRQQLIRFNVPQEQLLTDLFLSELNDRFFCCSTKSMRSAYQRALGELHLDDVDFPCPLKSILGYHHVKHAIQVSPKATTLDIEIIHTILATTCLYDMISCGGCHTVVSAPMTKNCLCGACKYQMYCSVACQRAHRREHQVSCCSNPSDRKSFFLAEIRARALEGILLQPKKSPSNSKPVFRIGALYLWLNNRLGVTILRT